MSDNVEQRFEIDIHTYIHTYLAGFCKTLYHVTHFFPEGKSSSFPQNFGKTIPFYPEDSASFSFQNSGNFLSDCKPSHLNKNVGMKRGP